MRFFLIVLLLAFTGCSSPGGVESANPPPEAVRPATAQGRTLVLGRGPAGAVVVLEPLFEHEFPAAVQPAHLDQAGQMFIPGLLAARTGQEVEFRSSEDVLHNVRVDFADARDPIFNVATPPFGKYVYTFKQAGFYNVSCDIHTTMRATLFIVDAPYVAQVPESGEFSFPDVVRGSYRVTGFAEDKVIDKTIEVAGAEVSLTVP